MRKSAMKSKTTRGEWRIYRDRSTGEERRCLTLEGLSHFCRLPLLTLRRMVQRGLISPLPGEDLLFSQEMVPRIAKVERLRVQLQIDLDTMDVILELLDRMEAMDREISLLRRRFPE